MFLLPRVLPKGALSVGPLKRAFCVSCSPFFIPTTLVPLCGCCWVLLKIHQQCTGILLLAVCSGATSGCLAPSCMFWCPVKSVCVPAYQSIESVDSWGSLLSSGSRSKGLRSWPHVVSVSSYHEVNAWLQTFWRGFVEATAGQQNVLKHGG